MAAMKNGRKTHSECGVPPIRKAGRCHMI